MMSGKENIIDNMDKFSLKVSSKRFEEKRTCKIEISFICFFL